METGSAVCISALEVESLLADSGGPDGESVVKPFLDVRILVSDHLLEGGLHCRVSGLLLALLQVQPGRLGKPSLELGSERAALEPLAQSACPIENVLEVGGKLLENLLDGVRQAALRHLAGEVGRRQRGHRLDHGGVGRVLDIGEQRVPRDVLVVGDPLIKLGPLAPGDPLLEVSLADVLHYGKGIVSLEHADGVPEDALIERGLVLRVDPELGECVVPKLKPRLCAQVLEPLASGLWGHLSLADGVL